MTTLREQILALISETPGMTDREITNKLKSQGAPLQPIHQACRALELHGLVFRRTRSRDGLVGNYVTPENLASVSDLPQFPEPEALPLDRSQYGVLSPRRIEQDHVKGAIEQWLVTSGWTVQFAGGQQRGLDIEATKSGARWVIEARGQGEDNPMGRNYFSIVLGNMVQRMDDAHTKYSLAFPEIEPFLGMWRLFSPEAKSRLGLTILFVDASGRVKEAR